ncbi:putative membrane protein [Rhizobiales bacterium GAS113]|nr:putative membrane protein [Rhizobiales bacterium GAS113]
MLAVRLSIALATLLLASSLALAQGAKLTDPQIAHIAYTASVIDIKAAQLALKKSKTKDVIAFAKDMVRDHSAVNKKALALVKKLKVTPEDNGTSKGLIREEDGEQTSLAKLKGNGFDRAYAANEVAYHKMVNGTLKTVLIPSATNPELKDLLSTGLKIFEGHQQHAEHLVETLK